MSTTSATAARVWRVGADVDTDQLAPGHAMKHGIEVIARHCLEAVRPDFASGVQPGDVLVAGSNFGIGSSREQAASALVHLGVAAVIAPSFSGLYFRNAFNVGLLLLTCADALQLLEGERIAFAPAARRSPPSRFPASCSTWSKPAACWPSCSKDFHKGLPHEQTNL